MRAAAITYGPTITATATCFVSFWSYAATGRRLIVKTADQSVDSISRSVIPGVPINAAATLIALWSPYTAIALLAAMALFYGRELAVRVNPLTGALEAQHPQFREIDKKWSVRPGVAGWVTRIFPPWWPREWRPNLGDVVQLLGLGEALEPL